MRDFRRFAQLASAGEKCFIITHSDVKTPYASTRETADDLLQFVQLRRESVTPRRTGPLVLRSRALRGKFRVMGYEGETGEDHLHHLRHIAQWWKLLPMKKIHT